METAQAALQKKIILTETYEDMKNLIFDIVWKFQARHGGEIDDLIGQANLLFIYAVDRHDKNKGKLTTWLVSDINYQLQKYVKNEYKQTHISIDNEKNYLNPQAPDSFSIMEFLDEMEQDMHIILQLLLETPREIIMDILNEGKQMNHIQGYMRKRLRNRLRQMGWTLYRIKKTLDEIKNIINC